MTLFGLTLVLAAALCHATWNFFVKRINGGPHLLWLFSALSTVLYLPLANAIVVLQEVTFDLEESLFIARSVALHLAYVLLLQAGHRNGDLVCRDRRRGGAVGPGLETVTRSFRTATRPAGPLNRRRFAPQNLKKTGAGRHLV